MLRRLEADDPRFKTVSFQPGLNLLVAHATPASSNTDSRNGSGKSSVIELLHFLLGARADPKSPPLRRELRQTRFSLTLDWPPLREAVRVERSGANPKSVRLEPDISPSAETRLSGDGADVPVGEWQALIEAGLFGLRGEHPGVSGRAMLAFLIRRDRDHGFNEPTRSFARQPEAQAGPNLAHLLGLDADLTARYLALAERRAARTQLKKVAGDPVWGKVVGKSADLRGQIAVAAARVNDLRRQVAEFRVLPHYESLRERADDLDRRLRELVSLDVMDRHNLDHLQKSVEEAEDPESAYLLRVYEQLSVNLGDQVRKQYDQVKLFHEAVVRNRRTYLDEEIRTIRDRLEARRREQATLAEEQRVVVAQLDQGGALEALTELQKTLAGEEANVTTLRHRLESAEAVEATTQAIAAESVAIQNALRQDIGERQTQTAQAHLLFNELAYRLYGSDRPSYLRIDPGPSSLRIIPNIGSDDSKGIGRMATFCFDMTLAVVAHRAGRGPDFLVHDSHLFDGVDDRQLARALDTAARLVEAEGMQYVVTINEDDLNKTAHLGFDPEPYVIEPRLTDAYEEGGLFGFRFDAPR